MKYMVLFILYMFLIIAYFGKYSKGSFVLFVCPFCGRTTKKKEVWCICGTRMDGGNTDE